MHYKLRDYQSDLINKVDVAFTKYKRVLLVAPCGSGKTVIASDIINNSPGNVLFIVHRKELVDQLTKTLQTLDIPTSNIHVAMIQSFKNMLNVVTFKPDLIIIDEAHHATSKSYVEVLNHFSNVNVLGLTATPVRMSGMPLGDLFEYMVTGVSANDLINRKYLADYDYYAPKIDIDFTAAKIVAGDYKASDIDFLMDTPKIYGDIINNYKKLADNKKTIIYCSSIEYSKKIETLFIDNWYPAKHFDGSTPKAERDQIIQDFRDDKIKVLINVDLVGEGFDVPDCECVILLRPTQSLSLYIQQSTRCLRVNGTKKAVIIDFVGNAFRHGMPTEDRKWSLVDDMKCTNKTGEDGILVRQCVHCYKCYQGTSRNCPYCSHDNGKTRQEIARDEQIELELIKEVKKKEMKREQAMAHDMESLIALGRKRGYEDPHYWARMILKSRRYR